MKRYYIVYFLSLCSLLGCANIIDLPDNPELNDVGPWYCLDNPKKNASSEQSAATVHVRTCDFISKCTKKVTDLTARLCNKRDVGCTNPISTNITDEIEGELTFEVPTAGGGFDGYLEISSPTALCTDKEEFGESGAILCSMMPDCDPANPDEACLAPTYAPSLLFFNPPVIADTEEPIQLPLLSTMGLPSVVQAAGVEMDASTGNLFIIALDCYGSPVSGVTYSISQHEDKVTQLYLDTGVVSDTSMETDESGIGGFVGVPPGFAEVVGYNSDNERIGKIGVQAFPFTMTYTFMVPSS